MTDHDDELSAFLRSEVPEPGANYWDNIDAMLNRVEDERDADAGTDTHEGTGDNPGRPHLTIAGPVGEEISDEMQTDEDVPRLTDMTHSSTLSLTSANRRFAPMLVAATILALVGVGTIFAISRNQSTTAIDTADGDGTPTSVPVADDADDQDEEDNNGNTNSDGEPEDGSVAAGVTPGSVWTYSVDDLPRPLLSLGDNAEPFDGQIWVGPLVATGAEGVHVDQPYLEFEGLDQANIWLPVSTIEQVADGLPSIDSAEVTVIDDEPARPLPDTDSEQIEVIAAGTTLTSSGLRSEADGISWLLILSEFPFFVPEDSVTTASDAAPVGPDGRLCYSDDRVALTLDFDDNGAFTGWQVPLGFAADNPGIATDDLHLAPNGNLLLTLAGVSADEATGTYRVSESSVAALRNDFSSISTLSWTITSDLVTQPTQIEDIEFAAIDCSEVSDDLAPIEAAPDIFPPDAPFEPVTITEIMTTAGQNRVCYSQGDGPVFIFDFTDDGTSANGLNSAAMETISATKTIDGDTTYNVATLILGDRENGRDTVRTILWEITPERINLPFDGEEIPAVDCATVADEVDRAEDFLAAAPYPAYPLGS